MKSLQILCAVLLSVFLTGCDPATREQAKDTVTEKTGQAVEKSKELGSSALDKSKELGNSALNKSKELGNSAINKGKEIGSDLLQKSREVAQASLQEVQKFGEELVADNADNINAAGEVVNEILDKMARDPDTEVTTANRLARMTVLMVPIVGPTKRYSDARKLYAHGMENGDESEIAEARRECLLAMAEAGLDIGTLGLVGGRVDAVATGVDKVLIALKASRNVGTLVGTELATLNDFFDELLAHEEIGNAVDGALSIDFGNLVDSPEEPATDGAPSPTTP